MPSYNIKQIAYTNVDQCVSKINCDVVDVQGSAQKGDDPRTAPYQQIVIHPINTSDGSTYKDQFDTTKTYYLSLTIPKNQNYNLQFGIRLITYDYPGEEADLDSLNYQFVKYITSQRVSSSDNENSRVVLFQEKDPHNEGEYIGDIKVVIAEELEEDAHPEISPPTTYVANTMYHYENEANEHFYFWCKTNGEVWPSEVINGQRTCTSSPIGKNDILLSHSWKMSQTDLTDTYNIIFKPRVAGLNAIYLHLIPNADDNDIQWQKTQTGGGNKTYYGRHIDLSSSSFNVELYQLKDLISETVRRLGIWGHPGLMFHIEGEELIIGPSGYYELHDFPVSELGIAAFGPEDKFTIDIQYT